MLTNEFGGDLNKLFNKIMESQVIARMPKEMPMNTPKKRRLEDGKMMIKRPKLVKKSSSTERHPV